MATVKEYKYSDIEIGTRESFEVSITTEMEEKFRSLTGDVNPMHCDDSFAKEMGGYSSHIVFGMMTASFISTLAGVYLPGKYSLIHSVEMGFTKPVFAGDVLTVTGECIDKQDGLNLIVLKVTIKNASQNTVSKGKMKIKVLL
ncbi:MAG: hypothetical protein MJ107_00495 [Lachnospiraceae bacterium]|nr:hypothetical protein [Lachnospiraceae bacterium]